MIMQKMADQGLYDLNVVFTMQQETYVRRQDKFVMRQNLLTYLVFQLVE